jgi:hypothetical protein
VAFSSGVFSRIHSWAADKLAGTKITASRMDTEMDGFATGLSTCILKDGTQTITAAIPFNAQNITGVGSFGGATMALTGAATATSFVGSAQPGFSAHKNGSDQVIASSENSTQITFGTEVFDTGSYYNAATSTWTPPAGVVSITAVVYSTTDLTDEYYAIQILKNGSSFKQKREAGNASGISLSINIIDRANGTDAYTVYVSFSDGYTVSGLAAATFFMGSVL